MLMTHGLGKDTIMGPSKSQGDEFIVNLFEKILDDFTTRYPSEAKSFRRDKETIRLRVASEGLSFLTKTLPKLGKAFDRFLESDCFVIPREFKPSHRNSKIPALLQGIFKQCLLPGGNRTSRIDVVKDVRQFCFLVYKYEIPSSRKQNNAIIAGFISVEQELRTQQLTASLDEIQEARQVVEGALKGFDPFDVTPRHGPGAVSTGEKLEEKWEFSRLYSNIHQCYPYYTYFIAGGSRELSDRIKWYKSLERLETGQAKVVLVPKDSRGPRLISCEPLEYQWIQQGLGRGLMRHLERNPLTKRRINFVDQSVNAELARESSLTREFSTIDLKDASDRVSLTHVDLLFPENIRRCLLACRSASTLLPDGREVALAKFAPMGSALCFPVEALVFWALSVVAVRRSLKLTFKRASKLVFVYGDDIIVPTSAFQAVIDTLQRFCLQTNVDKCFKDGWFRESCGMDAFRGVSVTPTKLHTVWSPRPGDGMVFASYVAYSNALSSKGYNNASQFLFSKVEENYGNLPYGTPDSSFPNRNCHSAFKALILNIGKGFKIRWNTNTNQTELLCKSLKVSSVSSKLDGWPRLLRSFSTPVMRDPSLVVLPRSSKVKSQWRKIS